MSVIMAQHRRPDILALSMSHYSAYLAHPLVVEKRNTLIINVLRV